MRMVRPSSALAAVVAVALSNLVAALSAPLDAQVDGLGGTLVVTNKSPATATIIDVATGRAVATLPTGQGPHEVALSSDGRTAVVTNYGGSGGGQTLTIIDVSGPRVLRTIDLGSYTRPHGVAFLPGDSLVAVTSESTRHVVIAHIERALRTVIATGHDGSHMLAVTADGTRIFTGDIGSGTVSELDVPTGRHVRSFDVPAQPEAINVAPDGTEVWVGSNATGRVSVLDPETGAVTTAAEGFGWPYRILFTPDARTVLVPDLRREELRFIERASRREIARLDLAGAAPQGITITPDGRFIFLSLSRQARVAIIDAASRSIVGYLPAGETPDGVVYSSIVFPRRP